MRAEISQQLFNYRNTPHPLTGVSSASLLRGRELRSPLCISDFPRRKKTGKARRNMQERARVKQSKLVTERVFPKIRVGDLVRIRRPGIFGERRSDADNTPGVVEKLGQGTFRTSDGRIWSARRLAVSNSPIVQSEVTGFRESPFRAALAWSPSPSLPLSSKGDPVRVRSELRCSPVVVPSNRFLPYTARPSRVRKPPAKLNDFIM